MKKSLLVGAATLWVAACARRVVYGFAGIEFDKLVERLPESAPPKWLLRNITAIRENTERILQRLEAEHSDYGGRADEGDRLVASGRVDPS